MHARKTKVLISFHWIYEKLLYPSLTGSLAIKLPLHTFLAANSSSAKVWERQCALHISQGYTLPRKPNKHRRWNDNKPKNWTVDKWVLSQSLKSIGFIFNSLQRESEIGDYSQQIESPSLENWNWNWASLKLKLNYFSYWAWNAKPN